MFWLTLMSCKQHYYCKRATYTLRASTMLFDFSFLGGKQDAS